MIDVEAEARKELDEENRRALIEARKAELRTAVPWYERLFPWRILVVPRSARVTHNGQRTIIDRSPRS